ncbi:MAG: insulinase family protein [Ruminococcaceae bacterium]|nr:insulinase family protein [Oscillospiraceae bacterium]
MNFKTLYNEKINEKLYVGMHKSGLKVCVMPKNDYVKSYAVIGTDFGSVNNKFIAFGEREETFVPDGIAHFLEHKMFEQPDGTNVFESFARYGANANAYTSFDITAYLFESSENVYENLEILLDYIQKPYFTDENVLKEQGIIGQEIKMYDDEPSWRLMMNFLSSMYHNHPVRIDIAGSVDSISKITKDTLLKCYNTFYDMSNMALFIVGNVDPCKIGKIVEKNIISNKAPHGEIVRLFDDEPDSVMKSNITQKLSVSVPSFMFGFKDISCGKTGKELLKKSIELSIVSEIIFGKTGRLHNRLYNEGHILGDLETEVSCEKNYGFVAVSGESQNPDKVKEIILEEIAHLKEKGISKEDASRTKKALYGSYIKMFNSVSAISHSFMSNIFKGIMPFDFFDVFDIVTHGDIEKRLNEYFDETKSVLSVITPV